MGFIILPEFPQKMAELESIPEHSKKRALDQDEVTSSKKQRENSSSDEYSDFEDLPEAPHAPQHGIFQNQQNIQDLNPDIVEDEPDLSLDWGADNTKTDSVPTSPPASPLRQFSGCSDLGDYVVQKKIGEGTFGEVSLALHKKTKQRVALKRILVNNEREGMPMTALREIRILKKLQHPNIIKLNEIAIKVLVRDRKESRVTFMVFPYLEHDLDGLLQNPEVKFTPAQLKSYMMQILRGVAHLHSCMILHRDIKSSNILVSEAGRIKIADFGLARPYTINTGNLTNMVVTRWYRPPELLMGCTEYDSKIDMWGVGCVFGEMLKRRAILPGTSDLDQLKLIWNLCGTPNSKNWPSKSYLNYPMFLSGGLADFDVPENIIEPTIDERFPSRQLY